MLIWCAESWYYSESTATLTWTIRRRLHRLALTHTSSLQVVVGGEVAWSRWVEVNMDVDGSAMYYSKWEAYYTPTDNAKNPPVQMSDNTTTRDSLSIPSRTSLLLARGCSRRRHYSNIHMDRNSSICGCTRYKHWSTWNKYIESIPIQYISYPRIVISTI